MGTKRRTEGLTDVEMETPMSQEDVEALNKKHRQSYGYSLSMFGLLWPRLLGRIRKEMNQRPGPQSH